MHDFEHEKCYHCGNPFGFGRPQVTLYKYHFHGECFVEYLKGLNEKRRREAEQDAEKDKAPA